MYQRIVIGALSFLISGLVFAQDKITCKSDIKKTFFMLNTFFGDSANVYVHYKVVTTSLDNNVQSDEIKVYMSDSSYVVTSSISSYFSDKHAAFIVIPSQHKIYRVDLQSASKYKTDQMKLYQSSFLDSSTVLSCILLENGMKKITVSVPLSYVQLSQINKIDYIIDLSTNKLIECVFYYVGNSELKTTRFTFIEMSHNVQLPFKGSVTDLFLVSDKKMKTFYSEYSYSDLRQIK